VIVQLLISLTGLLKLALICHNYQQHQVAYCVSFKGSASSVAEATGVCSKAVAHTEHGNENLQTGYVYALEKQGTLD